MIYIRLLMISPWGYGGDSAMALSINAKARPETGQETVCWEHLGTSVTVQLSQQLKPSQTSIAKSEWASKDSITCGILVMVDEFKNISKSCPRREMLSGHACKTCFLFLPLFSLEFCACQISHIDKGAKTLSGQTAYLNQLM